MKHLFQLLLLLSFSNSAFSEPFSHTDTIARLAAIEYTDNADLVILNGFESAGSCPLSTEGLVIAIFRSNTSGSRSYSTALAAKVSGKKVRVSVDDNHKNEAGQCYVRYIELRD